MVVQIPEIPHNNTETNIFETCIGALNVAPIKISGQYKIVVGIDNLLYLDDYTGRRKIIDKTKNFLSQVYDFLNTKTNISDFSKLRYGAFQESKHKYFHIPLYLGNIENILPKYFVLSRVVNETITELETIYKYGELLKVVSLEKIGIISIINEILTEKYFEFPLYFNFNDSNITLYGYSLNKNTPTKHTFDISNNQANQNKFEVLNNYILNKFVSENIIYPKFINIEFEFEYENQYTQFNNFYGFLSNENMKQINI